MKILTTLILMKISKIGSRKSKLITLLMLVFISFVSCKGVKFNKGSGPVSKTYSSFLVGKDTTQYIVKRLPIQNTKTQKEGEMDFVFRKIQGSINEVTINITSYDSVEYEGDINVLFKANNKDYTSSKEIEIFYTNKLPEDFKNRFSVVLDYQSFSEIINADLFKINVFKDSFTTVLEPTKKTQKTISELRNTLFYK